MADQSVRDATPPTPILCACAVVGLEGWLYSIRYCPLHKAAPDLLAALEPFAAKDHGHTMSAPRETCIYCVARVAAAKAKGA